MTFKEQKQLMDECDTHTKAIGRVLAGTLNDDMRQAIQKAMLEGGEVHEKKEKDAITTIGEYREAKKSSDLVDMKRRYDAHVAAEAKKKGITDWTKQAKLHKDLTDTFVNKEYDKQLKYQKTSGLFGLLMSFLFRQKSDIETALK